MVTHISVQMSAERRPSFSDIVLELEATSEEDDEEKPAALGKTHLYISKVIRQTQVVLLNFF